MYDNFIILLVKNTVKNSPVEKGCGTFVVFPSLFCILPRFFQFFCKKTPDFTRIFFKNNFQTYPARRRHSEEKFADNTICRHVIPPDRKIWAAM